MKRELSAEIVQLLERGLLAFFEKANYFINSNKFWAFRLRSKEKVADRPCLHGILPPPRVDTVDRTVWAVAPAGKARSATGKKCIKEESSI